MKKKKPWWQKLLFAAGALIAAAALVLGGLFLYGYYTTRYDWLYMMGASKEQVQRFVPKQGRCARQNQ